MNTSLIPLTACAATLLAACGGDDNSKATVYESRGVLQCQNNGLTPQQSALKLTNAGLDVLRSGCGAMTNVAFPQVCGIPTNDIALHEIRHESLDTAEQLGFQDVETLRNPTTGRGYEWIECDTRAIIP